MRCDPEHRIRLRVAYDGSQFHGWQIQTSKPSVEGELTRVVASLSGEKLKVWGASRTDAGVHAVGQVAAFDDTGRYEPEVWYRVLNRLTADGLVVMGADRVRGSFHPRHDARGKVYRYDIVEGFHALPLDLHSAYHLHRPLNVEAMAEAAQYLLGEHDFASFRGPDCAAQGTVRRLFVVSVRRIGEGRVRVLVSGTAFLKYMVRILVGTLIEVGHERRKPEWVKEVLEAKSRRAAGMTAPASGLTLVRVFHPDYPYPGTESSRGIGSFG